MGCHTTVLCLRLFHLARGAFIQLETACAKSLSVVYSMGKTQTNVAHPSPVKLFGRLIHKRGTATNELTKKGGVRGVFRKENKGEDGSDVTTASSTKLSIPYFLFFYFLVPSPVATVVNGELALRLEKLRT